MPARPVTSPPALAPSAEPAKWLSSRISLFGPHWVTSNVGTGWPAYARIFHPLDDTRDALRWADIAHAHGHTMHTRRAMARDQQRQSTITIHGPRLPRRP